MSQYKSFLLSVAIVFCAGCAAKPVIPMPSEQVDIALHCGPQNKDNDGCVVEDHDAVRVYMLTRKAMCGG